MRYRFSGSSLDEEERNQMQKYQHWQTQKMRKDMRQIYNKKRVIRAIFAQF